MRRSVTSEAVKLVCIEGRLCKKNGFANLSSFTLYNKAVD